MEKVMSNEKTPLLLSWLRNHVVSVTATSVDFGVTIFLTEIMGLWYLASNTIGATAGGIISFVLCRMWVFNQRNAKWHHQAFRYLIAVLVSIGLNTLGVWFFTEIVHLQYVMAKIITAVIIGVSVNFFMFRYFVFR
ncbi:MAG: GtrA family protein [Saprospiraceae bacterium]